MIMKVAVIHRAFEESSRLVAFVDAPDSMSVDDALEYAFERTQNLRGSWSRPGNPDWSEDVTVMADLPVSKRTGQVMGLRSTSVGDRMIIGKTSFVVEDFGFEKEAA